MAALIRIGYWRAMSWSRLFWPVLFWSTLVLPITLLAGCGGLSRSDGAPSRQLDPSRIDDAVPRRDPITKAGNKNPYTVLGKTYRILPSSKGYRMRGTASWYGTKFHGESTANGERYDLYAMTAAHCTLPIPTYVQVTNLENGKQCIVRVNDRGPFVGGRLIDLSYAAATKLGYAHKGTAMVEVTAIDPDNWPANVADRPAASLNAASAPAALAVPVAKPSAASGGAANGAMVNARGGGVGGAPIIDNSPSANSSAGANVKSGAVNGAAANDGGNVTIDAVKADTVNAINAAQVAAEDGVAGGTHYVQVGAFGSNTTAEKLRARLAGATAYRVTVQPTLAAPVLYRVRIGPFTNAIDAEQAREQLHAQRIDGARVVEDNEPRR
jgi:rare lipoprotein A